jgi:hypothetical protein
MVSDGHEQDRAERAAHSRRTIVATLLAAGIVALGLGFSLLPKTPQAAGLPPAATISTSPIPMANPSSPAPSPWSAPTGPTTKPSPSPRDGGWLGHVHLAGGYRIIQDPVPFGAKRKRQTAAYSLLHYGQHTWHLHPQVIVLHFTDGSSYEGAHEAFCSDRPDLGELPGDVAHFIIAQNGRIYQQLSTQIRGRHAIGLNWCAIGIEFVQLQGPSSHWADLQILRRRRQIDAGLALVGYLCGRYHIKVSNVIGHAMANESPFFKDLEGWKNDHSDWQREDVQLFRRMLAAWEKAHP